jgi:hypothetical protein
MTALDFPDSPSVGQVFDRWTYDGSKWVLAGASGANYSAAPVNQIVTSNSVVTLPTPYPGTNGARSYLPLIAATGDAIGTIAEGYKLFMNQSGLYEFRWGMWSDGTIPTYFRLRFNGVVYYESAYPQDNVILYAAVGIWVGLELEGVAGAHANDAGITITDLRRVK